MSFTVRATGVQPPPNASGLRHRRAAAGGAGAPAPAEPGEKLTYAQERALLLGPAGAGAAAGTTVVSLPGFSNVEEATGATAAAVDDLRARIDAVHELLGKTFEQGSVLLRITKYVGKMIEGIGEDVAGLVARAKAGDRTLVRQLIMNEWFALSTIFFVHPHFPVTIENIAPFWGLVLSAGFATRTVTQLAAGTLRIRGSGGIMRDLIFNAPNAIFLIFSLSNRWTALRTRPNTAGVPANVVRAAEASRATSIETMIVSGVSSMVEGLFGARPPPVASDAPAPAPGLTREEFAGHFESTLSANPSIMDSLRTINPATFREPGEVAAMLANWAVGNLYNVAVGTAKNVLRTPDYVRQGFDAVNSELWLVTAIIGFLSDITGQAFSNFFDILKSNICMAGCAWKATVDTRNASAGWLSSMGYGGASLGISAILSVIGCNCSNSGGSRKTRRRRRSVKGKSRRSGRGQRGGGYSEQNQLMLSFTLFTWYLLQMYAMTSHMTPDKIAEIEGIEIIERMALEIFGRLTSSGMWSPKFTLQDIDGTTLLVEDGQRRLNIVPSGTE